MAMAEIAHGMWELVQRYTVARHHRTLSSSRCQSWFFSKLFLRSVSQLLLADDLCSNISEFHEHEQLPLFFFFCKTVSRSNIERDTMLLNKAFYRPTDGGARRLISGLYPEYVSHLLLLGHWPLLLAGGALSSGDSQIRPVQRSYCYWVYRRL